MTHTQQMVDKLNSAMNRLEGLPFIHRESELGRVIGEALRELGEVKTDLIEVAYRPNPPRVPIASRALGPCYWAEDREQTT